MSGSVEVWLDADFLEAPLQIGVLSHDRGTMRFAYQEAWLRHRMAFPVDPELTLGGGIFHPDPELGNFRVFDDSAPDRWGQTLMKRREALAAKDEGRAPRTLYAWDYLLGVQDLTRQGALRYRGVADGGKGPEFLASHALAAPPVTSLRELEDVARKLTAKRIDDLDDLRRWLAVLVAPGASLGGGRPKANFTETDGSLWIAKFPARDDERDIGAWEGVVHTMAQAAGIGVPEAKVLAFGRHHHTFCVRRFDRDAGKRRFYASAMALLRKDRSEGTSYLELAEFIRQQGVAGLIAQDLEQMFRRVAFNVAVGNRDDHLRNHGFMFTGAGWRLSKAFDLNPNIDKGEHVLNLDDADNRPDLRTVASTAEFYGLSSRRGRAVIDEVLAAVRGWRDLASRAGISRADIELTSAAFAHGGGD